MRRRGACGARERKGGISHWSVFGWGRRGLTHHPPARHNRSNPKYQTDKGGLAALGLAKLALMFAGWYLANIYFNM